MHYQHGFHAGNFADVFKHVVLCGLLGALSRKSAPWSYLETHAGAGAYDLTAPAAARTSEFQMGIARMRDLREPPEPIATYLRAVAAQNAGGSGILPLAARPPSMAVAGALHFYPGSPAIARQLARDGDRLVLCEKAESAAGALRLRFARDAQVGVHERDGYEAAALLPPKEKRGLVLVDPPFERPDEFDAVAQLLAACFKRFAHGVYAAWYPLKNRYEATRFTRRVARDAGKPVLACTLDTDAPGEGQMRGCGMLVVNPPYRFGADLAPALPVLERTLAQGPRPVCQMQPVVPA